MVRKVTFTLDEQTLRRLQTAAARTRKSKSAIVREAIADYHDRIGKLSEAERLRLLKVMEEIMASPPSRPQEEVDREIAEIREARRRGGRRHPI
jgi:predicted DNA-binding protein